MCAKKGEVDKMPWELISGPHLSGGPGGLITYKLKSEAVKLWVVGNAAGEGGAQPVEGQN